MGPIVIENREMRAEIGLEPLGVRVVRSPEGARDVAPPAGAGGGGWEILDRSPVSARLGLRRAGRLAVIVRYEVDGGELRCDVRTV